MLEDNNIFLAIIALMEYLVYSNYFIYIFVLNRSKKHLGNAMARSILRSINHLSGIAGKYLLLLYIYIYIQYIC